MDFNDFDDNEVSGNQPDNAPRNGENGSNSSNKSFVIGIAILGGIVILAMIAMIAFVLLNKPATSTDLEQKAAEIQAQNTAISIIATQTADFMVGPSNTKSCSFKYSRCPICYIRHCHGNIHSHF